MAREHHWQATVNWERFRTWRFDRRMIGVIKREQEVMKRLEEKGSVVEEKKPPVLLVVRNPTPHIPTPPIIVCLPGYKPPPPPGDYCNPTIIVKSDSGASSSNYETVPELRHLTPEEQKKQRQQQWIKWAFKQAHENEIWEMGRKKTVCWIWDIQSWTRDNVMDIKFSFSFLYFTNYSLDSYIAWLCIPSIPEHHRQYIALMCITSIPNTQNTAIQLWLY